MSLAAAMDQGDYRFHRMPETSYYGGINSITKDVYGRIWFTGTDALYMYDAVSYHHVTLPNPIPGRMMNFTSVKSLPDGSLLVSTNVGLYSYDFRKEEFQLECSGSAGYMETEYKDQVWLMMNDTLSLFKGSGQIESYPFPDDISSLGGADIMDAIQHLLPSMFPRETICSDMIRILGNSAISVPSLRMYPLKA